MYFDDAKPKGHLKKILVGAGVATACLAGYCLYPEPEGGFPATLEALDTMETVPEEMMEAPEEDANLDTSLLNLSEDPIEDMGDETGTIAYANALVNPGYWGYWHGWVLRPNIFFLACGARVRSQPPQGAGDDTALNGVQFKYCHRANWHAQTYKV